MKEFRDYKQQVDWIDRQKQNRMLGVQALPHIAQNGDEVEYKGGFYKRILGKWNQIIAIDLSGDKPFNKAEIIDDILTLTRTNPTIVPISLEKYVNPDLTPYWLISIGQQYVIDAIAAIPSIDLSAYWLRATGQQYVIDAIADIPVFNIYNDIARIRIDISDDDRMPYADISSGGNTSHPNTTTTFANLRDKILEAIVDVDLSDYSTTSQMNIAIAATVMTAIEDFLTQAQVDARADLRAAMRYTTTEKDKLASVASGAQVNVVFNIYNDIARIRMDIAGDDRIPYADVSSGGNTSHPNTTTTFANLQDKILESAATQIASSLNVGSLGELIATSDTLTADETYKQLEDGFTLESSLPSGIELSNSVLSLPKIPPDKYFGLWASLEMDGTERDRILLSWGNAKYSNAPQEQGTSYIIIANNGANRIEGLNDAGTAIDNARSFNTTTDNVDLTGLTFGDNLIWGLDAQDNILYAYERSGIVRHDRFIPFTNIATEKGCAYYNGAIYISSSGASLDAYDVTSKLQVLDSSPLSSRTWNGMAISDSGILWMAAGSSYEVFQIIDTGATSLLSYRSYPNSANTSTRGLATDGTYIYAYDSNDNGYYRYPIIDAATGELGAGTFFPVSALSNEAGVSLATIPGETLTDTFGISDNDTPFTLTDGDKRVDLHYLRQPDGDIRMILASDSALLPDDAVVKLYAAALTLMAA